MISVVTITFNNHLELMKTLNSIGDIDGIESIVINGGTSPETLEFLKSYSGTVVNERDSGISDAFNKGLKLARGIGVMFLNSGDTLIDRNYFKVAEEKLKTFDFIHSDIIFDDPMTGPAHLTPALCVPGRGMPYFHQSMVVRKSLMDQVGLFDLSYKIAMDFDYVLRMQKLGAKGFYYFGPPTIHMDGMGISAMREVQSVEECKRSLRSHGLLGFENRKGLFFRAANLKIRQVLLNLKLDSALIRLKKIKQKNRLKNSTKS